MNKTKDHPLVAEGKHGRKGIGWIVSKRTSERFQLPRGVKTGKRDCVWGGGGLTQFTTRRGEAQHLAPSIWDFGKKKKGGLDAKNQGKPRGYPH